MKGYTTIEQSKKLLSLGLDPSTADMCYPHFIRHGADTYSETPEIAEDIDYPYEMPCWSLTALLKLMPDVHLKKYNYDGNTNYYITKVGIDTYTTDHYSCPIEAAIEMICWLIEQGYIKVNK